ncbi:MAG: AAA family ATPase [Muribaculaceae bacterium]|nr:AAA family ATPase [Muribaculaceae bacterium]
MKFRIIKWCYGDASGIEPNGADFLLEEDNWNDYGYKTSYHLYATGLITPSGKNETVGFIRIMYTAQQYNDIFMLRNLFGENIFESLPHGFVSLSSVVGFWRNLERILSNDQLRELVNALHIIVSENDESYPLVKDLECFKNSLLRDTTIDNYGLKLAGEIIANQGRHYDLINQPMSFKLPNCDKPMELNFSSGDKRLDRIDFIPSRLLAFIGNNGVGKSTLLYRLIRLLYTSPTERNLYKDRLGEVIPGDVGFSRLFMVSYSSLDNFTLPGTSANEVKNILSGIKDGYGRIVFCGLRDVQAEYQSMIEFAKINETGEGNNTFIYIDTEHVTEITLKSVKKLAIEFKDSLSEIIIDETKRNFWNNKIKGFADFNAGFNDYIFHHRWYNYDSLPDKFLKESTGIKFILHSLAIIINKIEWNSIILFDEPENHLQPPLLSKLLTVLRSIAHSNASLIMVATHSPVILQETFRKNIIIVQREGDTFSFRNPEIETYGENIGAITNEVFGLNCSITTYLKAADRLYNENLIDATNPANVGSEIRAYLAGKL